MKKKLIRLTESDLHKIVENSVKRIIREYKWEINNDSRGLDTNFYNTGIEGFDDEDDLDDDYKPLDGNLSFDNESDFYTSSEMDDNFDDSEYFEGKEASDSKNFDNNLEQLGGESEYEEDNDNGFYKNPQKEINNRLKQIKKGEPIENVFKVSSKPSKDIYTIRFNGKYNCIDANNGKLISDKWFDDISHDSHFVYGWYGNHTKTIYTIK